jgi:photosystem II Psb27 protein
MAATIVSSVSLTARPRAATRELRARAAPAKATRVVALRASSEKARPPRRRLHHLHIISITFRVASRFRPRAPAALRRHASTRRLPTDLDSALPYIESDPRQVEATTSRREVAVKALALFGFGADKETVYAEQTTAVINQVKLTLELPGDSPEKAAAIEKTRQLTNAWVAKYRRDKGITGRPSYGNVYSALNAVSGHYNNFGTKYPLPAKRKDRVMQEFGTAEIALSRGR